MPGLDDVLERLVTDPSFRSQFAADPAGALGGYELSADNVALLASQISEAAGSSGRVESRSSKSSLAGFMGTAGELADALGATDAAEEPPPMWFLTKEFDAQTSAETTGAVDPELADVGTGPDEPVPYMQAKFKEALVTGFQHASSDTVAEPTGQDVLASDPGDGGHAPLGEEHIEVYSWASSEPAAAEPGTGEKVEFVYRSIDFEYGKPGATSPEDLAARGDATQETGPIADVLYSAAGNSSDSYPGTPIVGDWDGDDDVLLGDGDADGTDFAAWQGDPVEPDDAAVPGELAGAGGSSEQESVSFVFEKVQWTYDPAAASADDSPGTGEDLATVDPRTEQGMSWQLEDAMISSYQMAVAAEAPVVNSGADVLVGAGGLDHGSASADIDDPATGGVDAGTSGPPEALLADSFWFMEEEAPADGGGAYEDATPMIPDEATDPESSHQGMLEAAPDKGEGDGTVAVGGVEYYFFDNTAIAEPEADAVSSAVEEPTARGADATDPEPVPAPGPEPTNEPAAAAEAPKAEAPKAETKPMERPPEPPVEQRVEAAAEPPAAPTEPEEPAAEPAPAS